MRFYYIMSSNKWLKDDMVDGVYRIVETFIYELCTRTHVLHKMRLVARIAAGEHQCDNDHSVW